MTWSLNAGAALALLSAAVGAALAAVSWRRREEPHAPPFVGLAAAIAAWSFVYAVELGTSSVAGQLFWQRVALVVAALVPPFWLLFVLRYVGASASLDRRVFAVLAAEPSLFAAAVVLGRGTGAVIAADGPSAGAVPVVSLSFGPLYYLHVVTAYTLVAAGLALLVAFATRTRSMHRRQVASLVAGALPPFAAHVLFSLGASPVPGLDLTPFAFAVTGVLFAVALFRLDLLDRGPLARKRAIDAMGDGLLVVDDAGRVAEVDDVVRSALDASPAEGDRAAPSLPGPPASLSGETVTASVGGRYRAFDLHASPIEDQFGRPAGHVVAFRDVTARERYEQRLEVANRLLRHNLRNDMNVVVGRSATLADALDGDAATAAGTIRDTAERLLARAEKARLVANAADRDAAASVVDAVAVVERALESVTPADAASVERSLPTAARIRVADEPLFEHGVQELVENALEHAGPAPTVRVSVECGDERVRVAVADDGPGLPANERAVLRSGTETPLEHSSGLGLWVARWSATTSDGTLTAGTSDLGGAVVTLVVPAVRE